MMRFVHMQPSTCWASVKKWIRAKPETKQDSKLSRILPSNKIWLISVKLLNPWFGFF